MLQVRRGEETLSEDVLCIVPVPGCRCSPPSVGVPTVTMVTRSWAKRPVLSVARVRVQTGPTADATSLRLVTRTTVTDRSSATVTRATRVTLTRLAVHACSSYNTT